MTAADPRQAYLARTAAMLREVFGGDRYSEAYLHWQYERAPEGREIAVDIEKEGRSLGHYCVVPQSYISLSGPRPMALSLNTAVAEAARGKGVFTTLAEDTYRKAREERGVTAVLGVANANSTPGFLGRLRFTHLGPLPVHIGVSVLSADADVASYPVTTEFLASPSCRAILESVEAAPEAGWSQVWTAEKLAWRLACPLNGYTLHADSTGVMITRTTKHQGASMTVVLKMLPRGNSAHINAQVLLRAACRFHHTFFYVYAGFNSRAVIRGLPLPQKMRPSPLNLIYRPLDNSVPDGASFRLATFEFLDFDAY